MCLSTGLKLNTQVDQPNIFQVCLWLIKKQINIVFRNVTIFKLKCLQIQTWTHEFTYLFNSCLFDAVFILNYLQLLAVLSFKHLQNCIEFEWYDIAIWKSKCSYLLFYWYHCCTLFHLFRIWLLQQFNQCLELFFVSKGVLIVNEQSLLFIAYHLFWQKLFKVIYFFTFFCLTGLKHLCSWKFINFHFFEIF